MIRDRDTPDVRQKRPKKGPLRVPLKKSATKAAVSANIRAELAAGKPQRQAVAIALTVQRRAKKPTKKGTA